MLIGIVVRFDVKPDRLTEFDLLAKRVLEGVRKREDGTIFYVCGAVDDNPDSRIFMELYRDREAFEKHEAGEWTSEFLSERGDLVNSIRVEFITPFDLVVRPLGEKQ